MDNTYVATLFAGWSPKPPTRSMRLFNKLFRRLGLSVQLHPPIQTGRMMSLEQRINMYHLINLVLHNKVPGSFLELGCAKGQSAVMMQKIMTDQGDIRDLHVYDSFTWGGPGDPPAPGREPPAQIRAALIAHFDMHGFATPHIHEGWFHETLPATIPDRIAFAHLDANYFESAKIGLEYLYPRLAKGAICLLDDYADTTVFQSVDFFKGVKQACDAYLADKPEEITLLYGGYDSIDGFGSHGYFIKR